MYKAKLDVVHYQKSLDSVCFVMDRNWRTALQFLFSTASFPGRIVWSRNDTASSKEEHLTASVQSLNLGVALVRVRVSIVSCGGSGVDDDVIKVDQCKLLPNSLQESIHHSLNLHVCICQSKRPMVSPKGGLVAARLWYLELPVPIVAMDL